MAGQRTTNNTRPQRFLSSENFLLGLSDLISAFKVNRRFEDNVGAVYTLKERAQSEIYDTLQRFGKRYLQSFGHVIKELGLSSENDITKSGLSLIATHCTQITSLKLWECGVDGRVFFTNFPSIAFFGRVW